MVSFVGFLDRFWSNLCGGSLGPEVGLMSPISYNHQNIAYVVSLESEIYHKYNRSIGDMTHLIPNRSFLRGPLEGVSLGDLK